MGAGGAGESGLTRRSLGDRLPPWAQVPPGVPTPQEGQAAGSFSATSHPRYRQLVGVCRPEGLVHNPRPRSVRRQRGQRWSLNRVLVNCLLFTSLRLEECTLITRAAHPHPHRLQGDVACARVPGLRDRKAGVKRSGEGVVRAVAGVSPPLDCPPQELEGNVQDCKLHANRQGTQG